MRIIYSDTPHNVTSKMTAAAGFDQNLTVFSPEGRLYQIEYALNAVQNHPLSSLAIRARDGFVFIQQLPTFDLLQDSHNTSFVFKITPEIFVLAAGRPADARALVQRVRSETSELQSKFGCFPTLRQISERAANITQLYSQEAWLRPYGCTLFFASNASGQIARVDPSGACFFVNFGSAGVKSSEFADGYIQFQNRADLDCSGALKLGLQLFQKYVNAGLIGDDVEVWVGREGEARKIDSVIVDDMLEAGRDA